MACAALRLGGVGPVTESHGLGERSRPEAADDGSGHECGDDEDDCAERPEHAPPIRTHRPWTHRRDSLSRMTVLAAVHVLRRIVALAAKLMVVREPHFLRKRVRLCDSAVAVLAFQLSLDHMYLVGTEDARRQHSHIRPGDLLVQLLIVRVQLLLLRLVLRILRLHPIVTIQAIRQLRLPRRRGLHHRLVTRRALALFPMLLVTEANGGGHPVDRRLAGSWTGLLRRRRSRTSDKTNT